jgi:arylsulfatase A
MEAVSRRRLVLGCLLLLGWAGPRCQAGDPPRPNVIVILADDLGLGDIRATNPESKIPTPACDRLAREGLTFLDAHTTSAVCTPTRYGLLTGRYAWRTRLGHGVLKDPSCPPLAGQRPDDTPRVVQAPGCLAFSRRSRAVTARRL